MIYQPVILPSAYIVDTMFVPATKAVAQQITTKFGVRSTGRQFDGVFDNQSGKAFFFHYEKNRKLYGWKLTVYAFPIDIVESGIQRHRTFTVALKPKMHKTA